MAPVSGPDSADQREQLSAPKVGSTSAAARSHYASIAADRTLGAAGSPPPPDGHTDALSGTLARTVATRGATRGQRTLARFPPVLLGMATVPAPRGRSVQSVTVCSTGSGLTAILDHRWIEVGPAESYGWWPGIPFANDDERAMRVLFGVPGSINGVGYTEDGTATRDPRHGERTGRCYHPESTRPGDTDAAIADRIRRAAASMAGDTYSINPGGTDCHEFVDLALAEAGLVDPDAPPTFGPLPLDPAGDQPVA